MSDSEFQVSCVGDLSAASCISAADIAYVAFRQEVVEKDLETDLQKDFLLQVKVNALSSSLSSFSPLICWVYRVQGTAA